MKSWTPSSRSGIVFLMLSVLLSVVAQFLLKYGMNQVGVYDGNSGVLDFCFRMVNTWVAGGLFLYSVSTIFWIAALTVLDLGFAYPLSSLQYVLVFLGAWYFFNDQITPLRVAALFVICLGVGCISLEPKKA